MAYIRVPCVAYPVVACLFGYQTLIGCCRKLYVSGWLRVPGGIMLVELLSWVPIHMGRLIPPAFTQFNVQGFSLTSLPGQYVFRQSIGTRLLVLCTVSWDN